MFNNQQPPLMLRINTNQLINLRTAYIKHIEFVPNLEKTKIKLRFVLQNNDGSIELMDSYPFVDEKTAKRFLTHVCGFRVLG